MIRNVSKAHVFDYTCVYTLPSLAVSGGSMCDYIKWSIFGGLVMVDLDQSGNTRPQNINLSFGNTQEEEPFQVGMIPLNVWWCPL